MRKKYMRIGLKSAAIAVALALNSLTAGAAGLGKINVLSALGQPLKAEVDISASRDETPTLAARLAPADAFKQQGIPYSAALSGLRMAIDKRPSGQPFVRITGERPLNEPFLELLVELSWGSGRLVREYTFLLDPPADVTQKSVATPVAPPEVKAEARPEPKVEARPEARTAAAEPAKKAAPAAEKPVATKAAAEGGEREVKRGETLGKIAAELKPEGVNLDQMLVALFRGNQDAFDGENMNRLRAGKILKAPEREEILAVDAAEARQIIVAQSADFNAYRKKLAGAVAAAPAKEEAPKQAVAGKITPKVEDKAPAAPAKDKLEVSRTEAAKGAKARIGALEEDLVARDRALKEANSRIAALEKNLSDLQKLAELNSKAGAQMQAQAGKPAVPEAKKPEPAPAKPVEAPKAVPPVATPPAPVVAAPAKPAEPAAPVEAPKPAEAAKPADAAKPAEAPKPAAPPKPAPKKAAPPPPPEPSFMEEWGNALMAGAGVLIAAVAGFFGFTAIRKSRKAKADAAADNPLTGSDLSANSVFGSTGGQSVDTGAALHTDFGQSVGGHDEGVDPVAEADVYMAYGRDAQAEEILLEALNKEPSRHTIHVKLLEIYSARKAVKQFETLAADLKGQTGGSGADWEKAAGMGRIIDPSNPLYSAAGTEPAPVAAAPAAVPAPSAASSAASMASTVILTPGMSEKMQATVTMPGQLAQMAAAAETQASSELASLDFDLDLGGPAAAGAPTEEAPAAPTSMDFDLDLGGPTAEAAPVEEPAAAAEPVAEPAAAGLDIDLGMATPVEAPPADAGIDFAMDLGAAPAVPVTPPPAAAEAAPAAGGLDFDFDTPAAAAAPEVEAPAPAMDLSSISLDLETPAAAAAAVDLAAASAPAEDSAEVTTKLELAQAYEEMGDKDGARELLQEVLVEGGAAQQETARARLAKL